MLRWMTPFLVAIFAIGTAAAQSPEATKRPTAPTAKLRQPSAAQPTTTGTAKPADTSTTAKPADSPATVKSANSPPAAAKRAGNPAAPRRATVVAARQLPPGLPRAHYKYRTTVAPAAPLYVRRGRALVIEEETEVLFAPVGVAAYAPASSAHRCCRAPRRCPAITVRAIPTAMTGPITAAPIRLTGTGCPTPAACSDIARNGSSTWQGYRERPATRPPPTRLRQISSPCSSPSPTANPRS